MDTWYIWKKEWHGFSYSVISGYYIKKIQSKDVEYRIKFLCCSTNFSNPGRQRVMARHRSRRKELIHAKRKKKAMHKWNLPWKKKFCLIKQYDTSHWILQKKKSFYLTELNSKNHWIPKENKSFCPNQQIGINHLVLKKNKIFHHINCGVIQGFPVLRKAVTTHVKKYRISVRVLI